MSFDLFANETRVAPESPALPKPIIGFYGNLYDWVDQDLFARMAEQRPHWSFVLVGKIMTDIFKLQHPHPRTASV